MKKILLTLIFSLSFPAYAEWDLIYKDATIKSEYFLNLNNYKRNQGKVRAWTLENFLESEKINALDLDLEYRSVKSYVEFDCEVPRLRILAHSLYEENMGKGKAIYSNGNSLKWMKISKNTVFSGYAEVICTESN